MPNKNNKNTNEQKVNTDSKTDEQKTKVNDQKAGSNEQKAGAKVTEQKTDAKVTEQKTDAKVTEQKAGGVETKSKKNTKKENEESKTDIKTEGNETKKTKSKGKKDDTEPKTKKLVKKANDDKIKPKKSKKKDVNTEDKENDNEDELTPDGKHIRSFKVKLPDGDKYEGRFTGLTPYQAANKALSKFFRESNKPDAEITFSICESTRKSKKSTYTYVGRRLQLEVPVKYKIQDGREIVKNFKNSLKKVKKADQVLLASE